MARAFTDIKKEASPCPSCKLTGNDNAGGLFQSSHPLPCTRCGGLGFVDIKTGEEFGAEDIYRAWRMVKDYFYQKAKSYHAQNKHLKHLVGSANAEPTKNDVYPRPQRTGGYGD